MERFFGGWLKMNEKSIRLVHESLWGYFKTSSGLIAKTSCSFLEPGIPYLDHHEKCPRLDPKLSAFSLRQQPSCFKWVWSQGHTPTISSWCYSVSKLAITVKSCGQSIRLVHESPRGFFKTSLGFIAKTSCSFLEPGIPYLDHHDSTQSSVL